MQTIGITGGTGFVGKHLCELLLSKGYKVIIFTRVVSRATDNPSIYYSHYHARIGVCDVAAIAQCDAVIHLAGANVAGARWTKAYKQEIQDSRIKDTQFLVEKINMHGIKCTTFIAASATGFYGADSPTGQPFTENAPGAADFLGETCKMWEGASAGLNSKLRRVIMRTGIVLGKESGAFPEFLKPIKMGIMPVFGNGAQVISWIHVKDIVALMVFALEHNSISGIFNAVASHPVSQKTMIKTIAAQKGGIAIPITVPSFLLKLMLGEMSVELLKSCTVSAQKTLDTGFVFQFPDVAEAVRDVLQ